ncbi:MAG: choice-of-anchor D domain-containing protein, partial [Lutibacter sp.]|uniref:beta strand repeat-containing protein n=1 Tax=Lutibacter sp. TaxID=1925666 RepID=UPI00299D2E7E
MGNYFSRITLFFLLTLAVTQLSFSQTSGDYRSTGTGDWEVLSTWETYNGTSWVLATSYPGQNTGTYMVTIQAGHTVAVNTNFVSANMGEVEVYGVLNLIGGSTPRTVTLNTQLLTIANGGELRFNTQKVDLYLPTNAVLEIQDGGQITGACSNNTEIYIGGDLIAVCNGGGGKVATFGEIVASGGTLNANIDNPLNNSVYCLNTTIDLIGSYSGSVISGETVSYSGFITNPSGTTTSYINTTSIPSYTLNQIGEYLFSYTVTGTFSSGNSISNTETSTITVSPTAVGGSISSSQSICSGTLPADLTLSGQTGTIQWQSSTDNINFINISGADTSTLSGAQMGALTTTKYYRAFITSGACTANSNTVTVSVSSPLITTGVSICQGDNSTSLSSSSCSAEAVNSVSKYAGLGSNSGSGDPWNATGNIYSDNGSDASFIGRGDSQNLDATNFGFAVPYNATIDGIEVNINRYSINNSGAGTSDVIVQLIKAGAAVGDNKAITGTSWSTNTSTLVSYGSSNDIWNTSLNPSDINDSNFGVTLKVNNDKQTNDAYVDYIQITVYYTVSGVSWYTTSTGGTAIGYGLSFDPVGVLNSGLADTNTPGTYTYYAECSSSSCSRTATNFVINEIPTITGTTPENRVGPGTVTLGATASLGAINWYDVPTGGTSLGTGTNFTTPSISTTTTYYVEATNSTCVSSRTAVVATVYEPDINITGNGTTINSGDITPLIADYTDFGSINLGTSVTKTFTIQNLGSSTLNLTGTPIVSGTGSSSFSITQPSANSIASGGADLTFSVTFNPTVIGSAQFDISISNNDLTGGENPYTFRIVADAQQNFFDSDGDGIFDNVDIDDDNDGITDSDEELNCRKSSVAGIANYKYLNETFGTLSPGSRTTINTTYNATTSYCYEPGTGSGSSCGTSWILDDGEYVVVSKITGTTVSDPDNIHGNLAWTNVLDHTSGDGDSGGMAVFNAAWDPGVFYETTITGVLPNVPISYSFWVLNIMAQSTYSGSILPNVTVQFLDTSGTIISSINTGQFGRCSTDVTDNSCSENVWLNFSSNDINIGNRNEFIVRFINNAPGGSGNDLALDDIVISQTLCDTDSDGVADTFDLDSDNDGIPDVVESGNLDKIIGYDGSGKINLGFPDTNGNGMNDASDTSSPIDSDGDGVPNYIDLDSDNDGIFDVDESGVVSTSAPAGTQNGDGDINGDGVGDGPDNDKTRETDISSNGRSPIVISDDLFTDGILDKYDYFDGSTFAGSYGNVSQGTGPLYVKDTDNDGIPDYIDVTSNGTTFDIAGTLYSNTNQTLAGLPVLDA